jgi:hypothetical protein
MIAEAYFFLLTMTGSGKATQTVGPFSLKADCEEIRRQVVEDVGAVWVQVSRKCWPGPVQGASK